MRDARGAESSGTGKLVATFLVAGAAGGGLYYYSKHPEVLEQLPAPFDRFVQKKQAVEKPILPPLRTERRQPVVHAEPVVEGIASQEYVAQPTVVEPVQHEVLENQQASSTSGAEQVAVDETADITFERSELPREQEIETPAAIIHAEVVAASEPALADQVVEAAAHAPAAEPVEEVVVAPVRAEAPVVSVLSSPAEQALSASHAQVLEAVTTVLRRDIDAGVLDDLSVLSEQQLRNRVMRLSEELKDRSKWEAVRLAEFLERNENLWMKKVSGHGFCRHLADRWRQSLMPAPRADPSIDQHSPAVQLEEVAAAQAKAYEEHLRASNEKARRGLEQVRRASSMDGTHPLPASQIRFGCWAYITIAAPLAFASLPPLLSLSLPRHQSPPPQEYHARLEDEKNRISAALDTAARARVREAQQAAAGAAGKLAEDRLQALSELQSKVAAADQALAVRAAYERVSARVHRISLATAALVQALEFAGPATQEVAALQVASAGDAVILKAIQVMPEAVHSKQGVATRYALQGRFGSVAKAGRVAALTPENSGVLGSAVGAAKAAIVIPATKAATEARLAAIDLTERAKAAVQHPIEALQGAAVSISGLWQSAMVKAGLTTAKVDEAVAPAAEAKAPAAAPAGQFREAAEAAAQAGRRVAAGMEELTGEARAVATLFDRAETAVAVGDLQTAVSLLSGLSGHAAEAVEGWVSDAKARMDADKAVGLMHARAALLAASLY